MSISINNANIDTLHVYNITFISSKVCTKCN